MKILFLSRWTPYPPDNGAKIRIFNVVKQLASRHEVSLLAFSDSRSTASQAQLAGLQPYCSSIRSVPYRSFQPTRAKALAGFVSWQPRSLVDTYSPEMQAAVRDALRHSPPQLLVASQLDMVPYALEVPRLPAVLEELELSVFRDAIRRATTVRQRLRAGLTWLKLSAYLQRALPRFEACTVVSERERANVRAVAPDYHRVAMVPNAIDTAHYTTSFGPAHPNTLVFAGSLTYGANLDAVRYFLEDVFPRIRRAVPSALLRVTGRIDGVDLGPLPRQPGVELTGHVDDVRPVVGRSCVSVVPLRLGGGTRLKILESMAIGTPVVSTSKGAEGLEVVHGEHLLLADDPQTFADRVVDLLQSPQARAHLAANARHLVQAQYEWSIIGGDLRMVVEAAAARTTTEAILMRHPSLAHAAPTGDTGRVKPRVELSPR